MTATPPAISGSSPIALSGGPSTTFDLPTLASGDLLLTVGLNGYSISFNFPRTAHSAWDANYTGALPSSIVASDVGAVTGTATISPTSSATFQVLAAVISGISAASTTVYYHETPWGAGQPTQFYVPTALAPGAEDASTPLLMVGLVNFLTPTTTGISSFSCDGEFVVGTYEPYEGNPGYYDNFAIVNAGIDVTGGSWQTGWASPDAAFGIIRTLVVPGAAGLLPVDLNNWAPVGSGRFPI